MQLNIDSIQTGTNIPEYMTMHELQQEVSQHQLQSLTDYKITDIKTYWTFRDDMAVLTEVL